MTRPRLWGFRLSPYSGKARAAFLEKGVDVDLVEIHPARRPPRLRELNPVGRVPVLEIGDGIAMRESSIICEWLEDRYPDPPLWPADADARAWARSWARYIDDVTVASFFLGMNKLAFGLAPDDPPDVVEKLHRRVPKSWPVLEQALVVNDGPWLAGEQFTYADLSAMPLAVRIPEWVPALGPDPAQTPRAAAWLESLTARPSIAAIDQRGERLPE